MTFARDLQPGRASTPGASELFAEVDLATGLPRKTSTTRGLAGLTAPTVVKSYSEWPPAAEAGISWPGATQ